LSLQEHTPFSFDSPISKTKCSQMIVLFAIDMGYGNK